MNGSSKFGFSLRDIVSPQRAFSDSRLKTSAARTEEGGDAAARLGQFPLLKAKSNQDVNSWWSSELSPRASSLSQKGFVCKGRAQPTGLVVQNISQIDADISGWAKANLPLDISVVAVAQVCPGRDMQGTSSNARSPSGKLLTLKSLVGAAAPLPHFALLCKPAKKTPPCVTLVQKIGPARFIAVKEMSHNCDELKCLELKEEDGYVALQFRLVQFEEEEKHVALGVDTRKAATWSLLFRNLEERLQFVQFIGKHYFDFCGRALTISGTSAIQLMNPDAGFQKWYYEGAVSTKGKIDALKELRSWKSELKPVVKTGGPHASSVYGHADNHHQIMTKQSYSQTTKLVGKDVPPKLGLHVEMSCDGLEALPSLEGGHRGGAGVVTKRIRSKDGGPYVKVEVEWYKTSQRVEVPLMTYAALPKYMLSAIPQTGNRKRDASMGDDEEVVGVDVYPYVGMRVRLRRAALEANPSFLKQAQGSVGTVVWIDVGRDADKDGVEGDSVRVIWDDTAHQGEYLTGMNGVFHLRHAPEAALPPPSPEPEWPEAPAQDKPVVDLSRSSSSSSGKLLTPIRTASSSAKTSSSALSPLTPLVRAPSGQDLMRQWSSPKLTSLKLLSPNLTTVTPRAQDHSDKPRYSTDGVKNYRHLSLGPDEDELVVGLNVLPEEGMRVVLRKAALQVNPQLYQDSLGGQGVITWVDPSDADGDGVPGDICTVKWDDTGLSDDYRTGFEGCFRLAKVP